MILEGIIIVLFGCGIFKNIFGFVEGDNTNIVTVKNKKKVSVS